MVFCVQVHSLLAAVKVCMTIWMKLYVSLHIVCEQVVKAETESYWWDLDANITWACLCLSLLHSEASSPPEGFRFLGSSVGKVWEFTGIYGSRGGISVLGALWSSCMVVCCGPAVRVDVIARSLVLGGGGGGVWECTASPVWCRPNAWAWLWAGRMALQGIAPVLGACCATSRCLCSEPWAIGHSLPCTWRFTHGPARTDNAAWCKGFICFLGQTRWYMQLAQNLLGISV